MTPRFALAASAFIALVLTAASGFALVPLLRRLHYGQPIRTDGPAWHAKKQGTPTMGGIMFMLGVLVAVGAAFALLAAQLPEILGPDWQLANRRAMIALGFAFVNGMIGFADDFLKVTRQRNRGLSAKAKLLLQVLAATGFLVLLQRCDTLTTWMQLPWVGVVELGWLFYPLAYLLIAGMVNAANLTDGLDGLASSVTFVVMLGMMTICSLLTWYSLGLLAAAVAGGCAGFLLWNFHPARVFMGDTGSMFLGGAVTALAFCMNRPELLLMVGIVYILEAASVVIQVVFFKLTHGRRLFKMTPLHHHFELCGWGEVPIVALFTVVAALGTGLGVWYMLG